MKVILDGRPTLGGIHRYTKELCRMLPSKLKQVHFDIFGQQPGFGRRVGPAGTGKPLPMVSGMRRCLHDQFFLPWAAGKWASDLLHAPFPLVPRWFHGAAVVTCHDFWLMEGINTKPRGFEKYYDRFNFLHALRRADHIITLSRYVAKELQNQWGCESSKVTCIPPPIPALKPDAESTVTRERFLLTVGTLEPRKNLERLLNAQARVYERTRVPLFLVGPYGWRAKPVLTRLSRMGRAARWLGPVQDGTLARLYQKASAVVQYSLDEGFDYTVAEALYFGRPLILSDIPVHREVARDLACYVSPLAPEQLAWTIQEVLAWTECRIKEHVEKASQILSRLKSDGRAERYLEVYEKALSYKNFTQSGNGAPGGG